MTLDMKTTETSGENDVMLPSMSSSSSSLNNFKQPTNETNEKEILHINNHKHDTNDANDFDKKVFVKHMDIKTNGQIYSGISLDCDPMHPPEWFDPVAFRRAQKLFSTYGVLIQLSQFIGLMCTLNIYEGLTPLLVTGYSRTVSALFTRYLSTTVHVKHWFEQDPFDPTSKAYRSLKIVRGLHRQVAVKMNSNTDVTLGTDNETNQKKLWISQYSMAGAQFTFIGLMALFPKELGFHNFTKTDFEAIFHFWRTIGHCLGVEDRFNLCSGTYEETVELCRITYFKSFLPRIKNAPERVGREMAEGIALAMNILTPVLNYNAMMHYSSPFLCLDIANYPLKSMMDYLAYYMLKIIYNILAHSAVLCWMAARFGNVRLWIAIKLRHIHAWSLGKWYAKSSYETDERCPFAVSINYQNAFESKLY